MARYIDAEKLGKDLFSHKNEEHKEEKMKCWYIGFNRGLLAAKHIADTAETADVATVVHGRWHSTRWSDGYLVRCSVCNYGTMKETTYCPNCGAKMDGEH